eukprot:192054-Hanusia_phi.AAC.1
MTRPVTPAAGRGPGSPVTVTQCRSSDWFPVPYGTVPLTTARTAAGTLGPPRVAVHGVPYRTVRSRVTVPFRTVAVWAGSRRVTESPPGP